LTPRSQRCHSQEASPILLAEHAIEYVFADAGTDFAPLADALAPKWGLGRRQLLRTGCGMAAAFVAMNAPLPALTGTAQRADTPHRQIRRPRARGDPEPAPGMNRGASD